MRFPTPWLWSSPRLATGGRRPLERPEQYDASSSVAWIGIPRRRLRDVGEARLVLEGALETEGLQPQEQKAAGVEVRGHRCWHGLWQALHS